MGTDRSTSLVLVVNDDADVRHLFSQTLTRAGFPTRECASGHEALAALLESEVSLVLLDSRMPGMDGLAVLETMRADPRMQAVPVIMVTGEADIADRVGGLDAGADDYVVKPIALADWSRASGPTCAAAPSGAPRSSRRTSGSGPRWRARSAASRPRPPWATCRSCCASSTSARWAPASWRSSSRRRAGPSPSPGRTARSTPRAGAPTPPPGWPPTCAARRAPARGSSGFPSARPTRR